MSDSLTPIVVEYLLVSAFALGFLSAAIFFYAGFRYWYIRSTRRNVFLAFLFGPLALGSFDVEVDKRQKFQRLMMLAVAFLLMAIFLFLVGVLIVYLT